MPDLKTAAFVFGGKYGKGYLSCRNKSGTGWSAPATVRIEGGSVGFRIGGSSTDLIMLVMSARGADKLLSGKFNLGAEGSVAAGPVGRTATAQTDARMNADILSWSRSQGLFAGLALERCNSAAGSRRQQHAIRQEAGKSGYRDERSPCTQSDREAVGAAEPVLKPRTPRLMDSNGGLALLRPLRVAGFAQAVSIVSGRRRRRRCA